MPCPNCGSPQPFFVGFEKWYAEHAGVIPRIYGFCHGYNGEPCCGLSFEQLVWMPAEDTLNFQETLELSTLVLTRVAERELNRLVTAYFDSQDEATRPQQESAATPSLV